MNDFNLENDIKDCGWFVEKVRTKESYAQNLYCALCNMQWQKIEVMPILKDELWHCSWRYAGGLVAEIRQEGDYMDWYCSGIRNIDDPIYSQYVSEGTVTEEIEQDLLALGWKPVPYDDDFV